MPQGHLYRRILSNGQPSRWHAVIDLPKDEHGHRRQHTRTFGTKRDALEWLATTTLERSGTTDSPLLADYLPAWLDGKPYLRASTRASYRAHIEKHLVPQFGATRLNDLSSQDIEHWHQQLLAQGVSAATVCRINATLSSAMSTAVRHRLIERNPVASIELPRYHRPEPVVWTAEQAAQFLSGVRCDPLHALWRLALVRGFDAANS